MFHLSYYYSMLCYSFPSLIFVKPLTLSKPGSRLWSIICNDYWLNSASDPSNHLSILRALEKASRCLIMYDMDMRCKPTSLRNIYGRNEPLVGIFRHRPLGKHSWLRRMVARSRIRTIAIHYSLQMACMVGIPHTLSGNLIGLYFMDFYLPF